MILSIETTRDWVVVLAGSLLILVFLATLIFTVVLGLAARALLGTIRSLLKDDVSPLVSSARGTVQKVQGTASFVGESAASPIIRVYGMVAGARRAIGVLSSFAGRGGDGKRKDS